MNEKWLEEKVPGYAALPGPDRGDAIRAFALLWRLFESRLIGKMPTPAGSRRRWDAEAVLCADPRGGFR